jgi:alkane 1-monooxygenase
VYTLALLGFRYSGIWCWSAVIYGFVFLPGLELFLTPNTLNMDAAEEEMAKNDVIYDYLLYLIVYMQIPTLIYFLYSFKGAELSTLELAGRITSMGLLCGTFGINVGHELGHRRGKFEQTLAKIALMSSLYMHFFIEHNKGHHKHVATPNDPSSARYNEIIYTFYFRTIVLSYLSAWNIANGELKRAGKKVWTLSNEMVQLHIIQLIFVASIYFMFEGLITLYFFGAAFFGIILLETVNYIEHYGLQRKHLGNNNYERTMPEHSWNSNHFLGRIFLFELSRHSDHHFLASRKYQVLRHYTTSPQLPTGYPGSMLISLVPPLWFYLMNKRVNALENQNN